MIGHGRHTQIPWVGEPAVAAAAASAAAAVVAEIVEIVADASIHPAGPEPELGPGPAAVAAATAVGSAGTQPGKDADVRTLNMCQ